MSPLFVSLTAMVFAAYILYGLAHWLLGPTEEQRRYAMHIWADTIILVITYTISWFLPSISIWAGNIVQQEIGYNVLPSVSWSVLDPDLVKNVLMEASNAFLMLGNRTAVDLGTLTGGIIILGLTPFTQAASMGLSQLSSMYYSAAIPVLIGSWVAGFTAKMAAIMVDFFPIFALMIATGRKIAGILGAGLVAFISIASSVLPLTAAAIANGMPPALPSVAPTGAGTLVNLLVNLGEAIASFFQLAGSIAPHAMFYAHALVVLVFAGFIMAGATASVSSALSDVPQFFEIPI